MMLKARSLLLSRRRKVGCLRWLEALRQKVLIVSARDLSLAVSLMTLRAEVEREVGVLSRQVGGCTWSLPEQRAQAGSHA